MNTILFVLLIHVIIILVFWTHYFLLQSDTVEVFLKKVSLLAIPYRSGYVSTSDSNFSILVMHIQILDTILCNIAMFEVDLFKDT